MFALLRRTIFDGIALNNSSTTTKTSRTFKKKADQKLVAIHLKVCEEQAYEVTSIVRRIIASSQFKKIYNLYVHLSPIYDFNQGDHQ